MITPLFWGDTKTTNESVGINIEFTLSDSLSFDFDYHDSFARVDGTTLPNEMGFVTPADKCNSHEWWASGIHTFTYDREFTASDFSRFCFIVINTKKMKCIKYKLMVHGQTLMMDLLKQLSSE